MSYKGKVEHLMNMVKEIQDFLSDKDGNIQIPSNEQEIFLGILRYGLKEKDNGPEFIKEQWENLFRATAWVFGAMYTKPN